ncbi:MAG: hypothetical protein ACT4P4_02990 [Betaproteobacteria bacterium]
MANLLKTGQLKEHKADPEELERLLAAAERGIADARAKNVSAETRYCCATSGRAAKANDGVRRAGGRGSRDYRGRRDQISSPSRHTARTRW